MDSPCHYCAKRTRTCHNTGMCPDYEDYTEAIRERSQKIREAAALDIALSMSTRKRAIKSWKRKYYG